MALPVSGEEIPRHRVNPHYSRLKFINLTLDWLVSSRKSWQMDIYRCFFFFSFLSFLIFFLFLQSWKENIIDCRLYKKDLFKTGRSLLNWTKRYPLCNFGEVWSFYPIRFSLCFPVLFQLVPFHPLHPNRPYYSTYGSLPHPLQLDTWTC